MQEKVSSVQVHTDTAGIHIQRGNFRDRVLRNRSGIAALRAPEAAEMPVGVIIIFILRFAVNAVGRIGEFLRVTVIQRHIDAEKHDRIRNVLRNGSNQRTVRIQAE